MSKVVTTTVLPRDGWDTLNIGAAGDTVAIAGDSLNTNVLQDAGGNNIFTSSSGTVSSSALSGSLTLLSSQTASSSASISFTTQLTSAYDIYCFKFITLHPSIDGQELKFQVNASGQTGFNETMTTTFFDADHTESDIGSLQYEAADDQAQGTAYQKLCRGLGNEDDEAMSGELYLFAPSNTTYVKQFYARTSEYMSSPRILDNYIGGYINTTAAITEIDFKFNTGNIDAGTIKLYGISKT